MKNTVPRHAISSGWLPWARSLSPCTTNSSKKTAMSLFMQAIRVSFYLIDGLSFYVFGCFGLDRVLSGNVYIFLRFGMVENYDHLIANFMTKISYDE